MQRAVTEAAVNLSRRVGLLSLGSCSGACPARAVLGCPARSVHTAMPTAAAIKAEILGSPAVQQLATLFREHHHDVRIVGGAVRDILMERQPKDYDLATDALPEQTLSILRGAGVRVVETGLQHGTLTAVIDNVPYEITTLRLDRETDGRRATVEFTRDWKEDAERRDLTINAMSMDLDGILYDYFDGETDLRHRRIRFVGDPAKRIDEDYLRVLRYFRFHGRVCDRDEYDSDQLQAIRNKCTGLTTISGERIWSEMRQILALDRAPSLLQCMNSCGIFNYISLEGVTNDHLNTLRRVSAHATDPCTRFVALLDSEEDVERVFRAWRFSLAEHKLMSAIVAGRDQQRDFGELQDCLVDGAPKMHVVETLLYQGKDDLAALVAGWDVPAFPVNGKALKARGVAPGKGMGAVLAKLKSQWKESRFQLSEEALLERLPAILEEIEVAKA